MFAISEKETQRMRREALKDNVFTTKKNQKKYVNKKLAKLMK